MNAVALEFDHRRVASRTVFSIEALLVWVYRDQNMAGRGGWGGASYSGGMEMTGVVCEHLRRGCSIDGGKMGWGITAGSAGTHPDAELVHACVVAMPNELAQGLVIEHGRNASRPDWLPHAGADGTMAHRLVPADGLQDDGADAVDQRLIAYEAQRLYWPSRIRMPGGLMERINRLQGVSTKAMRGDELMAWTNVVPLIEADHPDYVREKREHYMLWWRTLEALSKAMRDPRGEQLAVTVTAELPPVAPWLLPAPMRQVMHSENAA